MKTDNFLTKLPIDPSMEHFEDVLQSEHVRVERIVSHAQSSPSPAWYDQSEHEWVMVLQGYGIIVFEDFHIATLKAGDHILIPAHVKHKVIKTDPEATTVWLAVFYQSACQA